MSDLQNLLYHYLLESRLDNYLDHRECERVQRQLALEEEKLESLLPVEYKRLFREYGEHLHARTDLDLEAMFQATLALAVEFPA